MDHVEDRITEEELRVAEQERARIRRAINEERVTALRRIAALDPGETHTAPDIARRALRPGREGP